MRRSFTVLRLILQQPNFAGLLASAFALGMAFSFVVPFMSMWGTQAIGMSSFAFGTFMTLTSLSAIILSTTLGHWSDTHWPRKIMLILGACGGILGYCGYALVRDPTLLIVIGATMVGLASVCFSQLFAHTRETFANAKDAPVQPGLLMSVVRVSFSFSWTVGPAIGAAMMAQFGFRGVFFGAAGLYLIFLLGVLKFVPYRAHLPQAKIEARPPVWQVLTRPDIFACSAAFMVLFAAHAINMMNLPLTVTVLLGGTPKDLGIIFGVGPVVEIPLMIWFGHLAARGYQLRLIRFGAAVTVAYFVALSFVQAPWHIYLAQILSGISFAIMTNIAIIFFQDMLPGQAGLATAIFANASNLGNLIGYFSFGLLVERLGHRGVFYVCAVLTSITLVLLLRFRRPVVANVVISQNSAA